MVDAVARAAHEALASVEVKSLYAGDCKGCGECCSRFLPITLADEARLLWHLAAHPVEIAAPRGEIDLVCPLLSESSECMAYEARPAICRVYRCDLHAARKLGPSPALDGASVVDMRELIR